MRYAVKQSGVVVNIIEWDGEAEFNPGEGLILEPATDQDVIFDPDAPTDQEIQAAAIEGDYSATIARGVTVGGITLAAGDLDRQRFSELAVLLREAQLLPGSPITDETPQPITDIDGTPHTVTVGQLRAMLVQYGLAIQTAWVTRAEALAQLGQ